MNYTVSIIKQIVWSKDKLILFLKLCDILMKTLNAPFQDPNKKLTFKIEASDSEHNFTVLISFDYPCAIGVRGVVCRIKRGVEFPLRPYQVTSAFC